MDFVKICMNKTVQINDRTFRDQPLIMPGKGAGRYLERPPKILGSKKGPLKILSLKKGTMKTVKLI